MEATLDAALREAGIEIICLAGFMRLLSADFVAGWRDRILNIHPSLLPLFPGLHTHERALAAGVKLHGATVHFVRAEIDAGPIVAQGAVPVLAGDTPETLAARVLTVEHRLYPLALRLVASGRAKVRRRGAWRSTAQQRAPARRHAALACRTRWRGARKTLAFHTSVRSRISASA